MSSTGDCVCCYIKRTYQDAPQKIEGQQTYWLASDSFAHEKSEWQYGDDDDHKNIARGIIVLANAIMLLLMLSLLLLLIVVMVVMLMVLLI